MKYICYEGTEGVGKSTQVNQLTNFLRSQGLSVLLTKEPGTPLLPETLRLRSLILDAKFEKKEGIPLLVSEIKDILPTVSGFGHEMLKTALFLIETHKRHTLESRELIIQTVRYLHLEFLNNYSKNYDYVVQDRGILSGICYGLSNGLDLTFMESLNNTIVKSFFAKKDMFSLYDQIIILDGNVANGLKRALSSKKEFEDGDVMENKGSSFLKTVSDNFSKNKVNFKNVANISVDNKSIDDVFLEIQEILI